MFYWLSTLNQGLQGATLENQIPELASYDQAKQAQFHQSDLQNWLGTDTFASILNPWTTAGCSSTEHGHSRLDFCLPIMDKYR